MTVRVLLIAEQRLQDVRGQTLRFGVPADVVHDFL
jgi:hypothetical protein